VTDPKDLPPLPPFFDNAEAPAIVESLYLTHNRRELIARIGTVVGFEHDPDRDRLTNEELAKIAVYVLAHDRQI
jgi:hypothetical protein